MVKAAYYNGIVYTGELPLCRAFIVEDGRFRKTGTDEEVLSGLAPEDNRVDLEGRFVCAGFNDSHMHLLGFGNMLRTAQLAAHTGSLREMLAYMRKYRAENQPRKGQWLLGRGWNQDLFADGRRIPDRTDLDTISEDVPVMEGVFGVGPLRIIRTYHETHTTSMGKYYDNINICIFFVS